VSNTENGQSAEGGIGPERERLGFPEPRIYVASLSDYNAGDLHGEWIAADQDTDQLQADIEEMLATSPSTKRGETAEEWAIHDYAGFGGLLINEYESLERISRIASGIAEHGPAFAAWVDVCDGCDEQLDDFLDHFIGQFDSRAAFGDQLVDDYDIERVLDQALPGFMRSFVQIDAERAVRELEIGGDLTVTEADEEGVYVFNRRG